MACFKLWSNETAAKIRRYNFTCAGLWAGFDARQASEADLTWQYHHKNRAISPDWCKLWLDWSAQIFVLKSQESHVWQQAFTPHCHSFYAGQGLSKLAAGWRILAGIEKCYASANYQMKLLPGRRKYHFTWAGLWAALDVWWLPKAVDLTWQMNLVKKCYLASLIKVFNAVTEKVWGKSFLNY